MCHSEGARFRDRRVSRAILEMLRFAQHDTTEFVNLIENPDKIQSPNLRLTKAR